MLGGAPQDNDLIQDICRSDIRVLLNRIPFFFSKFSNSLLFLFSKKMLVIRADIYKVLVRYANREDSDQTTSK